MATEQKHDEPMVSLDDTEALADAASRDAAPVVTNAVLVKLTSKDGQTFELPLEYACISNLIKTSIETDKEETNIPIPSVTATVLSKVVDYMNHHRGVEPPLLEKPLRSKVLSEICADKWDASFIDGIGEDRQQLYDMILAANYMDVKSLLFLACAKVASLIKGQPLEQIKNILMKGMKPVASASATAPAQASQ